MTDSILVTLDYYEALDYLDKYPNSRFLKPVMDKIKPLEEGPINIDRVAEYPDGTIAIRRKYNPDYANPAMVLEGKWYLCYRSGFEKVIDPKSLLEDWTIVRTTTPKTPLSTVSFEIPIDEARKLGGCTLTPLVEAWDAKNKKVFKVGDSIKAEDLKHLPVGSLVSALTSNFMYGRVVEGENIVFVDHKGNDSYTKAMKPLYKTRTVLFIPE